MYNYPNHGQYGQPPPGMGGYPGQIGPPPGMGGAPGTGPPGMGAPGVGPAPGMQQAQNPSQGGFPPNFQPPPNMPNINFSAPVIRLGTSGPAKPDTPTGGQSSRKDGHADQSGNRRHQGLGFDGRGNQDQQRHQMRENLMSLVPPTREEIARTIFIGNITESCGGDDGMQRILNAGGGLRKWTRATDANDNKPCSFGFAEYEDADSLSIASEIFKDLEIPDAKPATNGHKKEEDDAEKEESEEPQPKTKLLVVVDDNSQKYMEEWRSRGSMKDPAELEFRIDSAREELSGLIAHLTRSTAQGDASNPNAEDNAGGQETETKVDTVTGEVVTIPITVEDELADIPAEMRETVAKEIAAFRDRSNRRDMERLKREEELERAEKQRSAGRFNRLGSPQPTDGIPVGPRDRAIQGAPLGPKAYTGGQIPRDYQKGVTFVNGSGVHGVKSEDEDSDASDEELERRRQEKRQAELEKVYLDQERRWLNRERSRTAAVEREKQRDKEEENKSAKAKDTAAKRYKEWDDDAQANLKVEEYYKDRSEWLRRRSQFRVREADQDARDRAAEEREHARDQERRNRDMGMADQFLAQQAEEMALQTREPQRFKMSLGAAAQRAQQAAAPRRTMAEVEGLLEDEEDAAEAPQKRTLVPITFDKDAGGPALSEEERAEAVKQLASSIPTDKEGLWAWPIKWDFVDDAIITEQLRPFVEKKIMEYLGVQEEMLVDVVEEHIKKKGNPQDLVGELEMALDEEAEPMVRKLWRMLIFFSESEKAGLSG